MSIDIPTDTLIDIPAAANSSPNVDVEDTSVMIDIDAPTLACRRRVQYCRQNGNYYILGFIITIVQSALHWLWLYKTGVDPYLAGVIALVISLQVEAVTMILASAIMYYCVTHGEDPSDDAEEYLIHAPAAE
jgi:hypothetical protein